MAAKSLVHQLLDEIADCGRTPEEVCRAYPELLPEVRRRWRQMCAVEAELDALFPVPGHGPDADSDPSGRRAPTCRGSRAMTWRRCSAAAAWASSTRPGTYRLNRPVALKMLLAGAYAGPDELARFQHEAEAVAACGTRTSSQVYDVGEHEGRPYLHHGVRRGRQPGAGLAGTPLPARQAAALLVDAGRGRPGGPPRPGSSTAT